MNVHCIVGDMMIQLFHFLKPHGWFKGPSWFELFLTVFMQFFVSSLLLSLSIFFFTRENNWWISHLYSLKNMQTEIYQMCVCVCVYNPAPPCISISRSKALPAVNLHTGWLFPQVELYDLLQISLSTTMALFWIQTSLLSSALQMIQSQTLTCALKSCDPVSKLRLMFCLCCYAVGKLSLTVVLHDKVHFLTLWAGCKINICQNPNVRKNGFSEEINSYSPDGWNWNIIQQHNSLK